MRQKKKILILGGSEFQIPVIRYARSAGYHVITCDYLPENPGHPLADEYHNVSTTDFEGVLSLCTRLKIDGILAYASDPAAPTAAFVGNKLGLPANPYEAVCVMASKDNYRAFLDRQGFHGPRAVPVSSSNGGLTQASRLRFPVMVKPVDSSGSKGVLRVHTSDELGPAVDGALRFSRARRAIVEEFLVRKGPQIGGEAFISNGKVVFMCLGDQLVDGECNPFVPTGMTFPSHIPLALALQIAGELQRLMDALQYSAGGLNLEVMLDGEDRIHLMEVGPRTGGNFLPELVHHGTRFNVAACCVETALGHGVSEWLPSDPIANPGNPFAYYAIHSRQTGVLESVRIDESLRGNILEVHQFKPNGAAVEVYNGSNCTIGILLLRFGSEAEMHDKMARMSELARPIVRPSPVQKLPVPR